MSTRTAVFCDRCDKHFEPNNVSRTIKKGSVISNAMNSLEASYDIDFCTQECLDWHIEDILEPTNTPPEGDDL